MSVFKDAEVIDMHRLPAEAPGKAGRMLTATFRMKGLEMMVLEGGPMFEFTPAVSFFVHCEEQDEVDELWDKLTADGGLPNRCGWLTDKFGVTWQIVPDALGRLMGDPNPVKARNVQQAMMKMVKLNIAELQRAYDRA
jgi:predicted 3-demethylubiquinone-9 3-methyltransferase (glyoxalase superfamily)